MKPLENVSAGKDIFGKNIFTMNEWNCCYRISSSAVHILATVDATIERVQFYWLFKNENWFDWHD